MVNCKARSYLILFLLLLFAQFSVYGQQSNPPFTKEELVDLRQKVELKTRAYERYLNHLVGFYDTKTKNRLISNMITKGRKQHLFSAESTASVNVGDQIVLVENYLKDITFLNSGVEEPTFQLHYLKVEEKPIYTENSGKYNLQVTIEEQFFNTDANFNKRKKKFLYFQIEDDKSVFISDISYSSIANHYEEREKKYGKLSHEMSTIDSPPGQTVIFEEFEVYTVPDLDEFLALLEQLNKESVIDDHPPLVKLKVTSDGILWQGGQKKLKTRILRSKGKKMIVVSQASINNNYFYSLPSGSKSGVYKLTLQEVNQYHTVKFKFDGKKYEQL